MSATPAIAREHRQAWIARRAANTRAKDKGWRSASTGSPTKPRQETNGNAAMPVSDAWRAI